MRNIRKNLSDKLKGGIYISAVIVAWTPVLVLGAYKIIQYPQKQDELSGRLLVAVDANKDRIVTNDELANFGDNHGLGYHPFESPMKDAINLLKPYLQ